MGQDFSPAPWGGAGMGLDPPHPASPHPRPTLLKIVIVNFNTLKPYHLNKNIISLFILPNVTLYLCFLSSKVGNKVPILTFSFVFVKTNLYTIELLISFMIHTSFSTYFS